MWGDHEGRNEWKFENVKKWKENRENQNNKADYKEN